MSPLHLLWPSIGFAWASVVAEQTSTTTKPNIVVIVADDMGYSGLGCYGGEIQIPNLDYLASSGLNFTQFYNSAKCEPTRASLMSGQYCHDCGVGAEKGLTMRDAMRDSGYPTFAIGKWHLTEIGGKFVGGGNDTVAEEMRKPNKKAKDKE